MAAQSPGSASSSRPDMPGPTKTCSCQRVKRWTTRVTIATFFLAGGIEYSVIFPTMWDYIHGMGGQEWMYGLSLAAFSISNLFAGPVYGLLFDITQQTKVIVLIANLFEIGGNFMYFSATSKYMILGSRFIVGLGAGAGATLFGELARISTKQERTRVFSIFSTFRQVGLILGPAFNLFLRVLNVKIGPFHLNKLTAPGAVMTVLWVILEVMFLFMFYQLPSAVEPVGIDSDSKQQSSASEDKEKYTDLSDENSVCEKNKNDVNIDGKTVNENTSKWSVDVDSATGETTPLLSTQRNVQRYSLNKDIEQSESVVTEEDIERGGDTTGVSGYGRLTKARRYIVFVVSRIIREEIVVLLAVLFLTVFSQTAIEAMLVPMAEYLLDWTETDTSIFYSAAGVEIIVAIIVVVIVSRWVGDRWQLIVGLVLNIFGYSWMLGWLGNNDKGTTGLLWKFIIGSVPIIFGLPFFFVTGASLYSKLLPMQVQGIGQGLRRSVFSLAAILGPLWAGGALAFTTYYILLGVPLALLTSLTVMVLLSFVKLKEPKGRSVLLP